MMPEADNGREKRKKILAGARAIFMREGLSAITMEQIAARQGISKKTLYKYFSNKTQLVEEAVEERILEIGALIDSTAGDRSQTFPQRLGRILGIVARQLAEIGDTLIRDIFYRQPRLWEKIDRFRREHIFAAITTLLEEGIRDGYVRTDIESRLVPTLFVNAAGAILTPAQIFALPAPPAVIFETFVRILLGGVLTEDGRAQLLSLGPSLPTAGSGPAPSEVIP
jgi:AcrR family transcriptional regulator